MQPAGLGAEDPRQSSEEPQVPTKGRVSARRAMHTAVGAWARPAQAPGQRHGHAGRRPPPSSAVAARVPPSEKESPGPLQHFTNLKQGVYNAF